MVSITLPTREITDRETFHTVSERVFGFPKWYGRNMDAWLDCMSCVGDADAGRTCISLAPGELLLIMVPEAESFRERAPDVFAHFIDCTGFANRRFIDAGGPPRIALLLA